MRTRSIYAGVLVWLDSSNITIEDNEIYRCSRAVLINEGVTGTFKGNYCGNNRNPAKFQNASTGWVIGGSAANDADNNTFFKTGSRWSKLCPSMGPK